MAYVSGSSTRKINTYIHTHIHIEVMLVIGIVTTVSKPMALY